MTPGRLTPNPKAVIKIRKVHNADKYVLGLKPSIVPEKKEVVKHIRNVCREDKWTKVPERKHQVYLNKNHIIIQAKLVEHFPINVSIRIIFLIRNNKHNLTIQFTKKGKE